jgi:hypothetical protein
MVWVGDKLIKLAHIDLNIETGTDIVLTTLGSNGGYVNSGVLGTDFDESPANISLDSQGRIWIIGTTYGFLNGSASICVYRLDNIDVIPEINSTTPGLGIKNDPMFLNSVGVSQASPLFANISLYPNPANRSSRVTIQGLDGVANEEVVWSIYSLRGKSCLSGVSKSIDCTRLALGSYVVVISSSSTPGLFSRLSLNLTE